MLPTPQFSQETKRVETESQVEAVNFQVVLRCMFLALFFDFCFHVRGQFYLRVGVSAGVLELCK